MSSFCNLRHGLFLTLLPPAGSHAFPDEYGEIPSKVHVKEGVLDVVDLHAEGLSDHHVEGAAQLALEGILEFLNWDLEVILNQA